VNRQIGVKVSKFLVVSGPLLTGHVTQRMRIGHYFARKRFTIRTLQSTLNHHRSQLKVVSWIGKWGSRFPNFWLLLAPYLQVTWNSACAMAIFVY